MRLADLIKASFGGDRSAAGRYAAEQRWKDHVKERDLQVGERRLAGVNVFIERKWGIDKMPSLKNVSTEALLRLLNGGVITAGVPYTSVDTDASDPRLRNTNPLANGETPADDRTAIVHHLVAGIVRNWESSASRTPAVLAKVAARDSFGLNDSKAVPQESHEPLSPEDAETLAAVVRAMYERTQLYLQENGFSDASSIALFRATKFPSRVSANESIEYRTAPLTSFTSEKQIAEEFANNERSSVVRVAIPKKNIFFINNLMLTGGWMSDEKEVIVLGGSVKATVIVAQPKDKGGR